MKIRELMNYISKEKFFAENFNYKLDDIFLRHIYLVSKFSAFLRYGNLSIKIVLVDHNIALVTFTNDWGGIMKRVFAVDDNRIEKFVFWLKENFMDFAWQTLNFAEDL